MSRKQIYLDYNATTPLRAEIVEAMQSYLGMHFGNPSSRHSIGQEAWTALEYAREQLAKLFGVDSLNVVFTSGATESNFLAIEGRFDELIEQGRKPESIRIAISAIEHPCVMACAEKLAKRGASITKIPVNWQGRVDPSYFDQDQDFDIVSVMAANHETGVRQPIREISHRLKHQKTFFHSDGAQWAGRTAERFSDWGVSAFSLSAHKMYGPKGIGALVLGNHRIAPLMAGSQEAGMRAGTVNVPGAVGLGKAAELAKHEQHEENQRLMKLRDHLWQLLQQSGIPIKQTADFQWTLSNTLHVRFPGIRADRAVDALDFKGLCCSAGPACASGANDPSKVLIAMGYTDSEAMEGVRFSLGKWSTVEEIERAAQIIIDTISHQAVHVA